MSNERPPSPTQYGRFLRERRDINDDRYVSLFVNLIRAALPLARPFMQALDIVMADEASASGEMNRTESESEIDETDFMPPLVPTTASRNPPSITSTTMWYSVVRGERVGIFNDLAKVEKFTLGVPNNKFKGFRLRSDAVAYFKEHVAKGEAYVIIVEESEEVDTSNVPIRRAPPAKPLQVELVSTVNVKLAEQDTESRICPRHALAESSVHESDIPDFSPDIREDVSAGSLNDDDSDYINAKQAVEYVDAQAHAVEAANERDRLIAAAEADALEKARVRKLRLEAIEKGLMPDPADNSSRAEGENTAGNMGAEEGGNDAREGAEGGDLH